MKSKALKLGGSPPGARDGTPMSNGNMVSSARPSFFRRLTAWAMQHWPYGAVAAGGVVVGLAILGAWNTAIEHTNHTEFCITCHIMQATVYQEFVETSHFKNKHGFHAGCPDCHVPQYDWIGEVEAKVGTVGELYAYFFQGMNKVENFEPIRPQLAKEVWAKFAATNARECRHCHDYTNMVFEEQKPSAASKHQDAMQTDENCVDCHKGITHKNFEQKVDAPAPTDFDVN